MKTGAAITAALACALAANAAESAPAHSPSRVTTAERLRVEFAPKASASTSATTAAAKSVDEGPMIRLPRLEVRDRPIPLRAYELLTPKGRLAVAKQTTLSPGYQYTFGPLSWAAMLYFNPLALLTGAKPNEAEAMALYEQNEGIRRNREIKDLEDLSTLAERAIAAEKRTDESSFRRASQGTRGGAD